MQLQVGKTYKWKAESSDITAKLVDIQEYPATGMPPDYIMMNIEGGEGLADAYQRGKLEFVLAMRSKFQPEERADEFQRTALARIAKQAGQFSLPHRLVQMLIESGAIEELTK